MLHREAYPWRKQNYLSTIWMKGSTFIIRSIVIKKLYSGRSRFMYWEQSYTVCTNLGQHLHKVVYSEHTEYLSFRSRTLPKLKLVINYSIIQERITNFGVLFKITIKLRLKSPQILSLRIRRKQNHSYVFNISLVVNNLECLYCNVTMFLKWDPQNWEIYMKTTLIAILRAFDVVLT